jgi:hypothetical protein
MAIVVKNSVAYANWRRILARYPRLIACMIEESLGYFTPHAAAEAIRAHKTNGYWGCEWYTHIDSCRNPGKTWDDGYNDRIKQINHDVISDAFSRRKYYRSEQARHVVQLNLNGKESVGAAWF